MTEVPRRKLGADAAKEEDELRILQAPLDLELAEAENLGAAVERLRRDDLARARVTLVRVCRGCRGGDGLVRGGRARATLGGVSRSLREASVSR